MLERIKETGDIFWAESDRDWVLDGADVQVSMVGFDDGTEKDPQLHGQTGPADHRQSYCLGRPHSAPSRLPENEASALWALY